MAWIELHQSLVEHKKMDRLVKETGLSRDTALGRLCMLWLWTLGNRPDGCLDGLDAARLGSILGITARKAAPFLDALIRSGFLDAGEETLRIHDWEDYAGRLMEIRRRDRDRKRQSRSRQREDCPADVGGTSAENPALPNPTQPDQTQPDPTRTEPEGREHPSAAADASGGCAGAREDEERTLAYLQDRGLAAERWFGATEELLLRSRKLCEALFRLFTTRRPTEADYARFFPCVTARKEGENGEILRVWDEDAADLLRYAFEQAAACGAGGNWPYIDGVLNRLHRRGIRTRRDAEFFDIDREAG